MSDFKKYGAYIVLFIMVFSTFSIILYTNNPRSDNDNTETSLINPEDQINIGFESDVNAIVKSFTKSYVVIGNTNNPDISSLDSALMKVKGVSSVNGQFIMNNEPSITYTYTYRADMSGYNIDVNKISDNVDFALNGLVENVVVYPYAQVEFDKNVVFKNNDLNITKEYFFGNPVATALLNSDSLVGDDIQLRLNVSFMNNTLTKIIGYELQNYSGMPINYDSVALLPFEHKSTYVVLSNLGGFDTNIFNVLDVNIKLDGNSAYLITEDINVDAKLLRVNDLVKNTDINVNTYLVGRVFVSELMINGQDYNYNDFVNVNLDYGVFDINNPILFRFTAYLQRGNILGMYGVPLN